MSKGFGIIQAKELLHFLHQWNAPGAVDDGGVAFLGPVQSEHQDELAARGGEPLGILVKLDPTHLLYHMQSIPFHNE